MKKIKIARLVTIPISYVHIINLLETLDSDPRFELHIVCSQGDFLEQMLKRLPNAKFYFIEIPREIDLIGDLRALIQLTWLFAKEKFDIVHSHTPKAGVTTTLAGFIARTPIRLHTFTGQVWATLKGPKRWLLIFLDRMIGHLNTHNYADSTGQKNLLNQFHIGTPENLSVLHKGSYGGINADRFNKTKLLPEISALKNKIFPNFDGKVLLYLGRMNKDKGLADLKEAFLNLKKQFNIKLLLVGPVESLENPIFYELMNFFKTNSDITYIEFTSTPELYLGMADIFCFPSLREGFGTVALEASAMELPVVARNVYGLSDAVADNESGLLFDSNIPEDFAQKLEKLLSSPELAKRLGHQGRERVLRDFSEQLLTEKMIQEYLTISKSAKN